MRNIKFSVFTISAFLVLGLGSAANARGIGQNNNDNRKINQNYDNQQYNQTNSEYRNNKQRRNTQVAYNNQRDEHQYDERHDNKVYKKVVIVEEKRNNYPSSRNRHVERYPQIAKPGIEVKINIPLGNIFK